MSYCISFHKHQVTCSTNRDTYLQSYRQTVLFLFYSLCINCFQMYMRIFLIAVKAAVVLIFYIGLGIPSAMTTVLLSLIHI